MQAESDAINLFVKEDRSPSGTGRAQFQTHALTQARRETSGHHEPDGGPDQLAPTHPHWAICALLER
jgi:hypothetical protein